MESEILAVEVFNAAAMPGNAGRYISIANGLTVDIAPRMRMMRVRFRLGCDMVYGGNGASVRLKTRAMLARVPPVYNSNVRSGSFYKTTLFPKRFAESSGCAKLGP